MWSLAGILTSLSPLLGVLCFVQSAPDAMQDAVEATSIVSVALPEVDSETADDVTAALMALEWVRAVDIDQGAELASIRVSTSEYRAMAMIDALKSAGFDSKILSRVTFQVLGMKKTRSGAT